MSMAVCGADAKHYRRKPLLYTYTENIPATPCPSIPPTPMQMVIVEEASARCFELVTSEARE